MQNLSNRNNNSYQQISKCFITSPHRISEKTSPSKAPNISHRTERQGTFENNSSFLSLNDSQGAEAFSYEDGKMHSEGGGVGRSATEEGEGAIREDC